MRKTSCFIFCFQYSKRVKRLLPPTESSRAGSRRCRRSWPSADFHPPGIEILPAAGQRQHKRRHTLPRAQTKPLRPVPPVRHKHLPEHHIARMLHRVLIFRHQIGITPHLHDRDSDFFISGLIHFRRNDLIPILMGCCQCKSISANTLFRFGQRDHKMTAASASVPGYSQLR